MVARVKGGGIRVSGLAEARKILRRAGDRMPVELAKTLTFAAEDIQKAQRREMERKLDRPTRFTLNATYKRPATPRRLQAIVGFKDRSAKAVPPNKWLANLVEGGKREAKRSERLLRARGILRPGWFMVPARGAKLNQYGNVSRGMMQRILSDLGSQFDDLANATAASRQRNRRARYFAVSRQTGSLPPGIYLPRPGGQPRLVFLFVKGAPTYRRRLDFYGIAEDVSEDRLPFHALRAARRLGL